MSYLPCADCDSAVVIDDDPGCFVQIAKDGEVMEIVLCEQCREERDFAGEPLNDPIDGAPEQAPEGIET